MPRVCGDWSDEAEAGYAVFEIDGAWSGGVIFTADRAALERIVADQEAMTADLIPSVRAEQDRLRFDGETLVHTSGADPDFRQEYRPTTYANGTTLYHGLGFGWTWGEET